MDKNNLYDDDEILEAQSNEPQEDFIDFEAIEENKKRTRSTYTVVSSVGALITGTLIYLNNISEITDKATKWLTLSNIFFAVAIVLIAFAGIVWSSGQGVFRGLGFTFKGMLSHFIPGIRSNQETNYYNYLQKKKQKKGIPLIPFFVVGGVFLVPSIVFMIMHYMAA